MNQLKNKIAILGDGQLGLYLFNHLENVKLYSRKRLNLNINDDLNLISIISQNDIIINCIAYTNVNKAQQQQELCNYINNIFVQKLVNLCQIYNKKFIHISTDYVYGNDQVYNLQKHGYNFLKQGDICHPCNFYGKSKILADEYIINSKLKDYLILRPSWLFGGYKNNFVIKIIDLIIKNKRIDVVHDQYGILCSVNLIYKVIYEYINFRLDNGLYNICLNNRVEQKYSRYQISKEIYSILQNIDNSIECLINPIQSNDIVRRQKNSLLDCSKLDKFLKERSKLDRDQWTFDLNNFVYDYFKILIH